MYCREAFYKKNLFQQAVYETEGELQVTDPPVLTSERMKKHVEARTTVLFAALLLISVQAFTQVHLYYSL